MDEIAKTVAGAVAGSALGLLLGRLFKRSDAMKELSDRVLILETTMQKHQEHDDQRFQSIEDKMGTFDKKLDSIHEEITGRFDRLTDLIVGTKK